MSHKLYETSEIWNAQRYLEDPREMERFHCTIDTIPQVTQSLLDVGAGNGVFLSILESQRPQISMEGIEFTNSGIENKICNAQIRQGDIASLPYPDNSFDVVTCLEVIEHLPLDTYKKGLHELARVAKKHVLISVPHTENRVNIICPRCNCEFHPHGHLRSFDQDTIDKLIDGFDVSAQSVGKQYKFILDRYRNEFRRVFWGKRFPSNTPCIQCGYTKTTTVTPSSRNPKSQRSSQSQKESLLRRTLFSKKPRWYVALYHKPPIN